MVRVLQNKSPRSCDHVENATVLVSKTFRMICVAFGTNGEPADDSLLPVVGTRVFHYRLATLDFLTCSCDSAKLLYGEYTRKSGYGGMWSLQAGEDVRVHVFCRRQVNRLRRGRGRSGRSWSSRWCCRCVVYGGSPSLFDLFMQFIGVYNVVTSRLPWYDHTWATTPDPIRTPQLSAHGRE